MSTATPSQAVPNLQELKEHYKQKLDQILYKELTPDNIDRFADEALNDLVALTSDILDKYKNNSEFGAKLELAKQQQEDDAYTKLDLPKIQEILQRVIEVRDKISGLKHYIEHYKENTDTVITPPQPDYHREITGGPGQGIEDKALIPRLLTLLYLLETDLEIAKDDIRITEGAVTPQMMRKAPYVRVEIPELKRVAYLCDEEGNASYVFYTKKLRQAGLKLEEIDMDDKGDKNSFISMHPGIGARIIYTRHWRDSMANVLSEAIPENSSADFNTIEEFDREKAKSTRSEFLRSDFLSFEEFQNEVKVSYLAHKQPNQIYKWYQDEYQKHPGWHSAPDKKYKDRGWQGWPELVGNENFLKKEYPSYTDFSNELKAKYLAILENNRPINILTWYRKVLKKLDNWPANPPRHYKKEGWQGWSDLLGIERKRNKGIPSFELFAEQVKKVYEASPEDERQENINVWYQRERVKHNWPANPYSYYKNKGWTGWPDLVKKEK